MAKARKVTPPGKDLPPTSTLKPPPRVKRVNLAILPEIFARLRAAAAEEEAALRRRGEHDISASWTLNAALDRYLPR